MKGRAACLPVAAVVLAAGSASRMGRLKQLLPFEGRALVENAVATAKQAGFDPVIVVVGAESNAVRTSLASHPVEIVENARWQSGMGSSIVAGIRRLQDLGSEAAAVAILLADQPLVRASHLKAMKSLVFRSPAPIVAARYRGVLGVPALFKRPMFAVLTELAPEVGARTLLRDPAYRITEFDLAEAAVDVDTPEDFAQLTNRQ